MRLPRLPRVVASALRWLQFPVIDRSDLDDSSRVCYGSKVVCSSVGRYSYIGPHCTVLRTTVGQFCSIASGCIIGGAEHPTDWVSTSPVFHKGANILGVNFSNESYGPTAETSIGNDVWIGSRALIKAGVRVGHGAVIGMGAVVTRDIGPYEIWAGNPARLIRARFDSEVCMQVEESGWWCLSEHDLRAMGPLFSSVPRFLAEIHAETAPDD